MRILTFDVGGANLKKIYCTHENGNLKVLKNQIHYFPFWKKGKEFPEKLKELSEEADMVAVTITAELSDVFSKKEEGINYIVSAFEEFFPGTRFLTTEKRLIESKKIDETKILAASNFTATAFFLESFYNSGIFMDIGSTTTDIIPFKKGENPYEKTDFKRLIRNQLVYSGILRTPVNCIVKKLPWKDQEINIASEYFAITADIYRLLEDYETYDCETPDGGGKSKEDCIRRISRLFCADGHELDLKDVIVMAEHVKRNQIADISGALKKVSDEFGYSDIYVCGVGKSLGIEAVKSIGLNPIDLSETIYESDNLPCLGLVYMVLENDRN